jgi:hypothetical protein
MFMAAMKEYDSAIPGTTPVTKEDFYSVMGPEETLFRNSRQGIRTNGNCRTVHFIYPSAKAPAGETAYPTNVLVA